MGRAKTIARRTFLIGSVAIAGGVAFGTYMVKRDPDNPLTSDMSDGDAVFNPWVKIDSEKVTLITPHGDKGQGAVSVQAALIAEELDIEFGQFETDFGKPSRAYWNTAMAEEAVPFMSTDHGAGARTMRNVMGGLMKVMGIQGTGGSTTVPDSFDKLRRAGAVARETLKLAASKQSGIPVEQLKTANGAVQLPDGTEIKYTDLAASAAGIEPVTQVKLRDPSQWRLIGKPMQRLDIVGKSTGTLDYGIDIAVDGMVHAAIKVNPRQGGKLNGYDGSAALEMRGVQKIVEITNGVAVIADNTWRAFQAAEAITFDWGEAPYPAEQDGHWEQVASSFTEERLDSEWRHDGEIDAALA
ncbi:MAG: xanthine dehydrogenase family protein molybdopterin-binding subunit, partial [Pseudomonadota bacterium]